MEIIANLADFMPVMEAAQTLRVSKARITELCRQGRFAGAIKISRAWLIPRDVVINHKPLPPGVKPKGPRREEVSALVGSAMAEAKEEE